MLSSAESCVRLAAPNRKSDYNATNNTFTVTLDLNKKLNLHRRYILRQGIVGLTTW